jgi:hypothetical protein
LPQNINSMCLGAVPRIRLRAGLIESVGMRPSRRPKAHGRKIEVWQMVDRESALTFLLAHSEPTLPAIVENPKRFLFDEDMP